MNRREALAFASLEARIFLLEQQVRALGQWIGLTWHPQRSSTTTTPAGWHRGIVTPSPEKG